MKAEDFLSGEDFEVQSQSAEDFLGGSDFDVAQGALSQSQSAVDRMRAEAQAAQAEVEEQPINMVKDSAIGTAKGFGQMALDTAKTALAAGPKLVGRMINPLGGLLPSATKIPVVGEAVDTAQQALEPANQTQQISKTTAEVASLALPTGAGVARNAPKIPGLISKGKEILQKPVKWAAEKIRGKTPEQLAEIPEDQVYKLSKMERTKWYNQQRTGMEDKFTQAETDAAALKSKEMSDLDAEAEALKREMEVASRDETLKLRPKIIAAMQKQSKKYRELVDDQISEIKDAPVEKTELQDFINRRYSEDPIAAQDISSRLGMSESGAETTIGKIYEKSLSLGQDIASAAKKGTRVYSPEEKKTDDAIEVLTDFMQGRGVDFSEARQFWAKYAPIRNQMVSEVKPFVQTPTQTKTFAQTLTRVAEGKDVNNENFIKEVEKLVGTDIGKDVKAAVAKLDANTKKRVIAEMETQMTKEAIGAEREQALKQLGDAEYEADRKARWRKVFWGALGALGIYTAQKATGIGTSGGDR